MSSRVAVSKKTRFAIFARDQFTCRYCGVQSDRAVLVIDHVVPVAQGGTSDPENLITACEPCNQGKGCRSPEQAAPTEADMLRLAQERNEQIASFELARQAMVHREAYRGLIVDLWCETLGRDSIERSTLAVMVKYAQWHGIETVAGWIDLAQRRLSPNAPDSAYGRYISGIRRNILENTPEILS